MQWKKCISIISMQSLLFLSLTFFFMSLYFMNLKMVYMLEWIIVSLNSVVMSMNFIFDWMSLMFMSLVLFISSMVMNYSKEYMEGDLNLDRFLSMVLLFVLSMMLLIVSPNLISVLLGWDGLGLVSYALVVYYNDEKSLNAGMITMLSNRLGDSAILVSIGLMMTYGSWNYSIMDMSGYFSMEFFSFMIIFAGMTKSAQLPFSAWLPAAMAAPTPVSALVHSSTLVTAGIYLIIRFSNIIEGSMMQKYLLLLSCLTMFMAGVGANFEYDLKKIIALSTLSQLGLMMSILMMGMKYICFFHLLSHALFKALLFLCAGVIIHSFSNNQDIRFMGGIVYEMPLVMMFMVLSNLALCGFPFLAGFYSKDMIIEFFFFTKMNSIIFFLYFVSIGLTLMYSFRLVYYIFCRQNFYKPLNSFEDSSWCMTNSMFLLGTGSVLGGSSLSWLIFSEPYMISMTTEMKLSIPFMIFVGFILGYWLSFYNSSFKFMYNLCYFFSSMWFIFLISSFYFSNIFMKFSSYLNKLGEMGWLEFYGGQGVMKISMKYSYWMELKYSKNFMMYLTFLVLWFMVFIMI
uniref:NADH dehydrogenase subunit 5 n=1 Tax=Lophogaster typicus TaxID=419538 RepID=UPI002176CB6C|nr:NADH dehydrogenase subunit 5 [Lophogaster typicus]UUL70712.1 NADH dehydrogenase subunit 5 [Lophogaster typicus]